MTMKTITLRSVLWVALLASCQGRPVVDPSPVADGKYDVVGSMCVATGQACKTSADCCAGSCDTNAYLPTWHKCKAPLMTGAYCHEDRACQSGHCIAYRCVDTVPAGACGSDADCGAGTFCDNATYAPWKCVPLRADGAFCTADTQCACGACVDYVCGGASCAAVGKTCKMDTDCCSGTFCDTVGYYISHTCKTPLADGSYCSRDAQCQSGNCTDYICATP
jgi:hypothetical protein